MLLELGVLGCKFEDLVVGLISEARVPICIREYRSLPLKTNFYRSYNHQNEPRVRAKNWFPISLRISLISFQLNFISQTIARRIKRGLRSIRYQIFFILQIRYTWLPIYLPFFFDNHQGSNSWWMRIYLSLWILELA